MTWEVEHLDAGVAEFHALDLLSDARRRICVPRIDRDAVALGSHQPESDINVETARSLGIDVVRRNSGGGAVWLPVGGVVWVDVTVPAGDSLWTDDVRESMVWLGRVWSEVVTPVVAEPVSVLEGALRSDALGTRVCFVSEGPGEVVTASGKVVGISQRRTRNGARFQCCLYVAPRLGHFLDVLELSVEDRARVERAHVTVAGEAESIVANFAATLNRIHH